MMAAKRPTQTAIANFRNIDHLPIRLHLDGAVPDYRLRTRTGDRRAATDSPARVIAPVLQIHGSARRQADRVDHGGGFQLFHLRSNELSFHRI